MNNLPILHLSLPVDDLVAARQFYQDVLGCRIGRERDDWFDAWFFGLQLTLQLRPLEVRRVDQQGVRHFGVVLPSLAEFEDLVRSVDRNHHVWLSKPRLESHRDLSGKVGGKLADPSGNIIEIKFYDDPEEYLD